MIIDMHTHSAFSIDADNSVNEMCKKAVEIGLTAICFTEHLDMNPCDQGYGFFKPGAFLKAVEDARKKYQGKIMILSGVEFSEPHIYKKKFQETAAQDFDVIMAAVHCLDDLFVGQKELLEKYAPDQIYLSYYKLVLDAVKFGSFDVMAHLDFPKRYIKKNKFNENGIVKEILQTLIKKNIALEINTSLLRKGWKETMPEESILKLYAELGGDKVTIGSDAHRIAEIASNFEYAVELIGKYKLTYGYYKKREFYNVSNFK